jgi:hypothetical protein
LSVAQASLSVRKIGKAHLVSLDRTLGSDRWKEPLRIIPALESWVDAANKNFKGFVPHLNFMLSDHRVVEPVWLKGKF